MKIGAVIPCTLQTRLGPVEYASVGEGAPVLVLHGSPGGIDAAELMGRFLPRERCRAILMSRPGYLGTELGSRRTLDEQGDLLAAVLDALDVDRAGVLAWSGGGPLAYRFAVRHPGRVTAIVAVAALSGAYRLPKQDPVTRLMFGTVAGEWLIRVLVARAPVQIVRGTLSSEGALTPEQLRRRTAEVMADDVKRVFVLGIASTASRSGRRRAGWRNDLEQFGRIESLELHAVEAPCLLVHGDVDTDVVPEHSRRAAAELPESELLILEAGTHFAFYTDPGSDEAQDRAIRFLLER